MSKLISAIQKKANKTKTFNGAKTFVSTNNANLDFFGLVGAMRGRDTEVADLFSKAFSEDQVLAIVNAFHLRDLRGGKGERSSFNTCMDFLIKSNPEMFRKVLPLIAEYGYYKELLHYIRDEEVGNDVIKYLHMTLTSDVEKQLNRKPYSLLAKWLPSENSSSRQTRADAALLAKEFGMSPRNYRKLLSGMRAGLNIVETLMSANKWTSIDHSKVSSKAAKNYRKAFLKRDPEGYKKFIERAVKGEVKINSSTLFPYEIIHSVRERVDNTLEAQWKQLPDYVDGDTSNAICVVDSSSSMDDWNFYGRVSNAPRSYTPMDVAFSLGIYFAERSKGIFAGHVIDFSTTPRLNKIAGKTLFEKVSWIRRLNCGGSTNIEAVFDLILDTAVKNKIEQSEMPSKIFIISDMEFDQASGHSKTNFSVMKKKYSKAGYEMPNIVFWNVNAHQQQAPVTKEEENVFLISGASPSAFKTCLTAKAVNPMELMLETLNSDRYQPVRQALKV